MNFDKARYGDIIRHESGRHYMFIRADARRVALGTLEALVLPLDEAAPTLPGQSPFLYLTQNFVGHWDELLDA